MTGRGAVSALAGGQEIALDLRQFNLDILLRDGRHVITGHWGKGKRLVVTDARPAGRR